MKHSFHGSQPWLVAVLFTMATAVVAQQAPSKDPVPRPSNVPADQADRPERAGRDSEGNAFSPREDRPQEPRSVPGRSPFSGRRGDPPRPDGPSPRGGFPPNGMPGSGVIGSFPGGPQHDPYRGPGGPDRLEELKKYDPEMYELEKKDLELEQQSFDLGQQYRRAPRDQRDALKTQLQDVVQKHFEARQARRQLQLKRLEEELDRMRSAMERRTESRVQIVERRVVELIGERSDFDF
jgi:hypothetical protein